MCSGCSGDYEGAGEYETDSGDVIIRDRRYWERRIGVRCECGHTKWWHMMDGKCLCPGTYMDSMPKVLDDGCKCVEYLPKQDRRKEAAA